VKSNSLHIISGNIIKSIVVITITTMLFACKNDMETISSFYYDETLPVETAKNIEMFYSDSGIVVIKLLAPRLNRYATDEPYFEFPEGLHLFSYDSVGQLQSELTANYGINYEKKKVMEVKDDVVIINHQKEETLNTEHVIWDQRSRKIYSDVFVKRTTPDGVLYGEGFDADESLKVWKLRKVSGEFSIDEEE
jgi:LPS export ABC transporter protein LptC